MSYSTIQFSFNTLPVVNNKYQLYGVFIIHSQIINNCTINNVIITHVELLLGNVRIENINNAFYITPIDNKPFTFLCTATPVNGGAEMKGYFYSKAIYGNLMPNLYQTLVRKFPQGVFKSFGDGTRIGALIYAITENLTEWYRRYFIVKDEIFANQYSSSLEFELNLTNGLLSDSIYPNELMRLLNSLSTYKLNSFDLELFLSKYIFYRKDISCAVYIDDKTINPNRWWILNSKTQSILDATTILISENDLPSSSVTWNIFNSSSFSNSFKQEIQQLILNISRCDIGNNIIYDSSVTPPNNLFDYVGNTYQNDPRIVYGKCLQFTGLQDYPLDVIGYVKKTQE